MEETYCTKTIILGRTAFREHDSKVIVYSLDKGKLDLVARGAKKIKSKLAAHLEPLNLTEIMVVRGKQFDYIGAASSQNCFRSIKEDLAKLVVAGKAINIFNKLVKAEEVDKEIFSLLKEFLEILDSRDLKINNGLEADFFNLKLLTQLGYKPELYNCVICNNKITPNKNSFDLAKGGLICNRCLNNKKDNILTISDNCIKILRVVVKSNFSQLSNLKIDSKLEEEVKNVISSFYQYYI